jgi:hypothetical protein
VLDYNRKSFGVAPANVPVLLTKLTDADRLLEDVRRILTAVGGEGQSVNRAEEVIASLKRLRWSLESQTRNGKHGRQTEAILHFSP